jgi:hypothetical protein
VHEIESGASVDRFNMVTRKNGMSYQLAPCTHPGSPSALIASILRPTSGGISANNNGPNKAIQGMSEYANAFAGVGNAYRSMHNNFYVPDAPVPGYSSSQTYFAVTEIDNGDWTLATVLQWGHSDAGGGLFWNVGAWRCEFALSCIHSGLTRVAPGDQISSDITSSLCDATKCTWDVRIALLNPYTASFLTSSNDTRTYQYMMAAVEHFSLATCPYFPLDGIGFTNFNVFDLNGHVTPVFTGHVNTGVAPQCGFNALPITNGVLFSHNMTTAITGPTSPNTGQNSSWTETGIGPDAHTYQWYRNDTLLAGQTGATLTFAPQLPAPFKLGLASYNVRTHWTDSVTFNATGNYSISIHGPLSVNAPGGSCNYNAMNQGGVSPITYDWQLNGIDMGGGVSQQFSITGSAGTNYSLALQETDGTGTPRSTAVGVHIVSSGGMTCVQ